MSRRGRYESAEAHRGEEGWGSLGPVIVIAIVGVGVVGCGACPGTVVRLEVVASLTRRCCCSRPPEKEKNYSTPRFIKAREQTFLQGSKNESSNIQIIHLFPISFLILLQPLPLYLLQRNAILCKLLYALMELIKCILQQLPAELGLV